jgi:hypothetical protein
VSHARRDRQRAVAAAVARHHRSALVQKAGRLGVAAALGGVEQQEVQFTRGEREMGHRAALSDLDADLGVRPRDLRHRRRGAQGGQSQRHH